jgi:hypothetical protein
VELEVNDGTIFEMGYWLENLSWLDPNPKPTTAVELDCLAQIMTNDRALMRQEVYGELSDFGEGEYAMTWDEAFDFPTLDDDLAEPDAWLDEVTRAVTEKTNIPECLQEYDEFIPSPNTDWGAPKLLSKMEQLGITPETYSSKIRLLRFDLFSLGICAGLVVTKDENPLVLSWDYFQHD